MARGGALTRTPTDKLQLAPVKQLTGRLARQSVVAITLQPNVKIEKRVQRHSLHMYCYWLTLNCCEFDLKQFPNICMCAAQRRLSKEAINSQ